MNVFDKFEVYILWLKVVESVHTDSHPPFPLSIPTILGELQWGDWVREEYWGGKPWREGAAYSRRVATHIL